MVKLRDAARAGEPFAVMALESLEHGNKSVAFWEAWKRYDREYAASYGKESRSSVNEISVNEEDFSVLVAEAAQRGEMLVVRVSHEKIRATRE